MSSSPKPPTMTRSRNQLAGAYAPHRPFIFEGGEGACITIPFDGNPQSGGSPATKRAMAEQISEYFEAWAKRARVGAGLNHPVPLSLAVDLDAVSGGAVRVRLGDLAFQTPNNVGYVPFPLSFVCKRCDLHRECTSLQNAGRDMDGFAAACPSGAANCAGDWQQIDVVLTHWSGSIEGITPLQRYWPPGGGEFQEIRHCESCRSDRFLLRRPPGPLAAWHFECASCHSIRKIVLKDRETLTALGPALERGDAYPAEINMEPISIRASALHYTHGDRLLVFEEDKWISYLTDTRRTDLIGFLASQFGYPATAMSDKDRQGLLTAAGRQDEWNRYVSTRDALGMLERMGAPTATVDGLRSQLAAFEADWNTSVMASRQQAAPDIEMAVNTRSQWVRRYDPVRMAAEHKTLEQERMHGGVLGDGKRAYVDVRDPDIFLEPDNLSVSDRKLMVSEIARRLKLLGIADLRLVRDVRVCEYTFGYSRTEPVATVMRPNKLRGGVMPVRLRLHGRVNVGDNALHPVLCVEQSNEGFYVRLDEAAVRSWLVANGVAVPAAPPGVSLGGSLIEDFAVLQNDEDMLFSRFLDEYKHERALPRRPYPFVYTLLHTMSHHLISVASAMSGLDLGSFGEHLFVPDLAFLVYRRGTTMDLGNLSSMWRERSYPSNGNEVLDSMVAPSSLRCGSESVCNHRGGACPDCILIPENTCLTRNELLSRSVLVGRGAPGWIADRDMALVGYYETARLAAGSKPSL